MEKNIQEVRTEIENTNDARYLKRLEAILFFLKGKKKDKIASELKVSEESVRRWVKAYVEYGIEALKDKKREGRPPILTAKEKERIRLDLQNAPHHFNYLHPRWTYDLLQAHIERELKKSISRAASFELLKEYGSNCGIDLTKETLLPFRMSDIWYIRRFWIGNILVGKNTRKAILLRTPHHAYIAINLNDSEVGKSQIFITEENTNRPNKIETFQRFLKRFIPIESTNKGKLYDSVFILHDSKWEKKILTNFVEDNIRNVKTFLLPKKSVTPSFLYHGVQTIDNLKVQLRDWCRNNKINPEQTSKIISDKAYSIFRDIQIPQNFLDK